MRDFTGAAELAQISPNVAGGLVTLKNRTVVDSHWKAHAKLGHEAFDFSSIFPGIDSNDDELVAIRLCVAIELRHLPLAWLTPGREKIEYHDLVSDVLGKLEGLTVETRETEVWCKKLRRVGAAPVPVISTWTRRSPRMSTARGPVWSTPGLTATRRTALLSLRPSFL